MMGGTFVLGSARHWKAALVRRYSRIGYAKYFANTAKASAKWIAYQIRELVSKPNQIHRIGDDRVDSPAPQLLGRLRIIAGVAGDAQAVSVCNVDDVLSERAPVRVHCNRADGFAAC